MPKSPAWIIKLGGSLAGTVALDEALKGLIGLTWPAVLVPGGGRFARTVRETQAAWGFNDVAAHRMAILAMTQYGLALASRTEGLVCADLETLQCSPVTTPVLWLPRLIDVDIMDRADIPNDWSVSSDSLALWLARYLGSPSVLLVKSCSPSQLRDASVVRGDALGLPAGLAARGRLFEISGKLLERLGDEGIVDCALGPLASHQPAPSLYIYCLAGAQDASL